jgi:hypothetical protein
MNKQQKIAVLVIVASTIVVGALLLWPKKEVAVGGLRLLRTIPSSGVVDSTPTQVEFVFSAPLDIKQSISFLSAPDTPSSITVKGSSVIVSYPQMLINNSDHTINIQTVRAQNGTYSPGQTLSFKLKDSAQKRKIADVLPFITSEFIIYPPQQINQQFLATVYGQENTEKAYLAAENLGIQRTDLKITVQ